MAVYKVRVTLLEHRLIDSGWTYEADELPRPGEAIEVAFAYQDEHPDPPDRLLARVTHVAAELEWPISAAEIDGD
jgi:hypothetical protein